MTTGQVSYYQDNSAFAGKIDDLKLGITSKTKSYKYDNSFIGHNQVKLTATAQENGLNSYICVVLAIRDVDFNPKLVSGICQTVEPSRMPPKIPSIEFLDSVIKCSTGTLSLEGKKSIDIPELEPLELGINLVAEGKVEDAILAYQEAEISKKKLMRFNYPYSDLISTEHWNYLCWNGIFHGHAVDVIDACKKAIASDPDNEGLLRDSHGIAKALSGNRKGAIEDLNASIKWSYSDLVLANYVKEDLYEWRSRRKNWISKLRKGDNPFTKEEIDSVNQSLSSMPSQPPKKKIPTFFCGQYEGKPATMARTNHRGDMPVIIWRTEYFTGVGKTPQKRCEDVSARFQRYHENNSLNYFFGGQINEYPVLCVGTKPNEELCLETDPKKGGILFFLRPGIDNPMEIIKGLLGVRDFGGQAILH